jgi:hypothetical protein
LVADDDAVSQVDREAILEEARLAVVESYVRRRMKRKMKSLTTKSLTSQELTNCAGGGEDVFRVRCSPLPSLWGL